MENKTPFSFKLFIINLCATLVVMVTATILSSNPAYRKYAVLSALPIILIFTFSAIGIYSAATKKFEIKKEKILNKVGLAGNIAICLLFLSLIVGGTVIAMR
jgi:hypothetical protein